MNEKIIAFSIITFIFNLSNVYDSISELNYIEIYNRFNYYC
jgi:hypothetical protein